MTDEIGAGDIFQAVPKDPESKRKPDHKKNRHSEEEPKATKVVDFDMEQDKLKHVKEVAEQEHKELLEIKNLAKYIVGKWMEGFLEAKGHRKGEVISNLRTLKSKVQR